MTSYILGTGSAVPANIVTNKYLAPLSIQVMNGLLTEPASQNEEFQIVIQLPHYQLKPL